MKMGELKKQAEEKAAYFYNEGSAKNGLVVGLNHIDTVGSKPYPRNVAERMGNPHAPVHIGDKGGGIFGT